MCNQYIRGKLIKDRYGINPSYLARLRRRGVIGYRMYGKQYEYCEQDLIAYGKPYYTLEEQARDWFVKCFENEPIPSHLPRDIVYECMDQLSISLSTACNGLTLARGGRKYKRNHIFS